MNSVFATKEMCCGCSACKEVCPKKAIEMLEDSNGFYYPSINQELCIDCGLCKKTCNNHIQNNIVDQKYYAAKVNSTEERMRSRSGGVFFALAKSVLNIDGVVYGVIIDDEMNVKTVRASTVEECIPMQSSKYTESDIFGVYAQIKEDLCSGKTVLFSGTGCQTAGLYGYLSANKHVCLDNLYTVDIVCHGVTSRKIFRDYVNFVERKYGSKIKGFIFRDKSFGWNTFIEGFEINSKKYNFKNYASLFYSNLGLRPSCGSCQFANYNRPADITLADFWGLNRYIPNFDDNKGVSAVILNTEKGNRLFDNVSDQICYAEVDKGMCSQPNLHRPTQIPSESEKFWESYKQYGFKYILKIYGRYDILRRIKWSMIDLPRLKRYVKGNADKAWKEK